MIHIADTWSYCKLRVVSISCSTIFISISKRVECMAFFQKRSVSLWGKTAFALFWGTVQMMKIDMTYLDTIFQTEKCIRMYNSQLDTWFVMHFYVQFVQCLEMVFLFILNWIRVLTILFSFSFQILPQALSASISEIMLEISLSKWFNRIIIIYLCSFEMQTQNKWIVLNSFLVRDELQSTIQDNTHKKKKAHNIYKHAWALNLITVSNNANANVSAIANNVLLKTANIFSIHENLCKFFMTGLAWPGQNHP